MLCARLPFPAIQPPTTNSWRLDRLDLHPATRALPGLVGRVDPLGEDALEVLLGARLEQRLAVADDVLGRLQALAGQLQRREQLAALGRRASSISEWPSSHSRSKTM